MQIVKERKEREREGDIDKKRGNQLTQMDCVPLWLLSSTHTFKFTHTPPLTHTQVRMSNHRGQVCTWDNQTTFCKQAKNMLIVWQPFYYYVCCSLYLQIPIHMFSISNLNRFMVNLCKKIPTTNRPSLFTPPRLGRSPRFVQNAIKLWYRLLYRAMLVITFFVM